MLKNSIILLSTLMASSQALSAQQDFIQLSSNTHVFVQNTEKSTYTDVLQDLKQNLILAQGEKALTVQINNAACSIKNIAEQQSLTSGVGVLQEGLQLIEELRSASINSELVSEDALANLDSCSSDLDNLLLVMGAPATAAGAEEPSKFSSEANYTAQLESITLLRSFAAAPISASSPP